MEDENKKSKTGKLEARLKGFLIFEIVVIVLLSVWLGFTGGFADLFRKDGEGVEPAVGRMVGVCLTNGFLIMDNGNGMVCGRLGAPMGSDSDSNSPQIDSVKMADGDIESGRKSYKSIAENEGRGTEVVLLEDSDEMYKFVEILRGGSYTLWVYYQGKKITVNGNNLTVMENALVRVGVPNRNRSDRIL